MIEIVDDGDETIYVYTGGGTDPAYADRDLLAVVSHEMYGWSGMQEVLNVIHTMAEIYDIEIHDTQDIV